MEKCGTCRGSGVRSIRQQTMLGSIQTNAPCNVCAGDGHVLKEKCNSCFGDGVIREDVQIVINIPAGVENEMQLSLGGKGNAAIRGGINGDLLVVIEQQPNSELTRDGNNLTYNLMLNFADAALGCTADVPLLSGPVKVKIAAGIQNGKVLRLKGKGLPEINNAGVRGDMLIKVNVWIPTTLSSEEKKLLEKLRESKNFAPNSGKDEKGFLDRMRQYFN